nr:DUF116 domain-containing protein [Gammaproteobacteria bacterium]
AYEAFEKTAGGVLYAALEVADGRVRRARLTGAVQLRPPRLLEGLAARLAGVRLERVAAVGRAFLATRDRELVGLGDEDVVRVLARASARRAQRRALGLTPGQVNTLMVHDPHGAGETTELLRRAEVVLVPYCAKPTWCKYRHREGCPECGRCEVGEVYRLGRERGLSVITIRNFEHLRETLARLRARGIEAYMGMCCSQFYLKREYAFREAGIPALLMDISGSNCYELGQEELAYQGRFEAQARLNAPVVERVLRFVPPRATEAPRPRRRRQGAG